MSKYEYLINKAEKEGVKVHELDFGTDKKCGKYIDGFIFINKNMTDVEKCEVLAEELGHHFKTFGDITNQGILENRKQEVVARRCSYNMLVSANDIIDAFTKGAKNSWEIAEYLNISEHLLLEIFEYLKNRYGYGMSVGDYYLQLIPRLDIYKNIG